MSSFQKHWSLTAAHAQSLDTLTKGGSQETSFSLRPDRKGRGSDDSSKVTYLRTQTEPCRVRLKKRTQKEWTVRCISVGLLCSPLCCPSSSESLRQWGRRARQRGEDGWQWEEWKEEVQKESLTNEVASLC